MGGAAIQSPGAPERPVTSAQLRQAFLDFFAQRGHQICPSASLVPAADPSLLFTNAGMVPFKHVFLGNQVLPYTRAVSVQRCMRAGGKHNDLENVGYTARHHTFFEMLGNFSFGDYFKQEAIAWAWDFLTQVLRLPTERLWVTVFETDEETAQIWTQQIGVPSERVIRCGEKDNFWAMGETGPCGPCTEIYYDHGPQLAGGPPGSSDAEGDRYTEIWNVVFMQFNRDASGHLEPLPRPCVDTGMGLERLAAVMQQVSHNFETDGFMPLVQAAQARYVPDPARRHDPAQILMGCRVLADHIRAVAFLIADGVVPSSEGRGYVLRRIMRRALRHAHHLGMRLVQFGDLLEPLIQTMGSAYPELIAQRDTIQAVIAQETQIFGRTLDQGMQVFEQALRALGPASVLPGDVAFKLYDTYGFPIDLTQDILRERGMQLDQAGFEQAMQHQKQQSQAHQRFAAVGGGVGLAWAEGVPPTTFVGYTHAAINAVLQAVHPLDTPHLYHVIWDRTPCYPESGGQVGDTAVCQPDGGDGQAFVRDTQRIGDWVVHTVEWPSANWVIGERWQIAIDQERRQAITRHHSATHLLHAALRAVLGPTAQQRGSWVGPDRLRFDFAYGEAVGAVRCAEIIRLVQAQIVANTPVSIRHMPLAQAKAEGVQALFDEKYGESVRVLDMGEDGFSRELCGGTHVERTGELGGFWIVHETSVGAGVRRIEAVAGMAAWAYHTQMQQAWDHVAHLLKVRPAELPEKIEALWTRNKQLERQSVAQSGDRLMAHASAWLEKAQRVPLADNQHAELVTAWVEGDDASQPAAIREAIDRVKDRAPQAVVVVVARLVDAKLAVYVGVGTALRDRISAVTLVRRFAAALGGKGGGRSDFAQAGGTDPEKIPGLWQQLPDWIRAAQG